MNKQNQNPIIPRLSEALGRELAKSGSQDAQQPRRGHQPTPAKTIEESFDRIYTLLWEQLTPNQ